MITLPHPPDALRGHAQMLRQGTAFAPPSYVPAPPQPPVLDPSYVKAMAHGIAMLLDNEAAREQGPTTDQLKAFIKSVVRELRDEEAPHHEFTY